MKTTNKGGMLSYLAMGILGLVLIIFRKSVDTWLFRAAGIGLIVAGILGVVGGWSLKNERSSKATGEFIAAIAMVAIGIWLLANPGAFKNAVNFIIGAVLIVIGAMMFAENRKGTGKSSALMAGSIMLLGAIVIIFHLVPKLTSWAVVICGVGLLYTAATGIVMELKKN